MERYEAYKDSGVEWIGAIPETWVVQRFRWTLKRVNRQPLESDEIVTCFRDGEVTLRKNRREDGFTMSDKEIGYQHICTGDFVIHGMDGFAGAMGVSDSDGKASPVLMAFRPIGRQDLRYINYLLRLYAWRNVFLALSTTIRVRSCDLNWAKVAPLPLTLPSFKEQQAIADYLDAKTSEIDALVADCEREVDLLQEYRKAVISEAVTKGLDPNAPMKDSGVEWIGEIPVGWEVVGFKTYLTGIIDYRGRTPEKVDEGVFLITGRNIKQGRIHYELSQEYMRPEDFDEIMSRGKLQIGNVLFTMEAPLGEAALIDRDDCAAAQRIVQLCCNKGELYGAFLVYWIMSDAFQSDLHTYATGSTASGIKASKLGMLRLVHPPLKTQHDIVEYLDAETVKIDSLIGAKQSMADKLREYRKSLISEAVTGKFKVPGIL